MSDFSLGTCFGLFLALLIYLLVLLNRKKWR